MSTDKSFELTKEDIKNLIEELNNIPLIFATNEKRKRINHLKRKLKHKYPRANKEEHK